MRHFCPIKSVTPALNRTTGGCKNSTGSIEIDSFSVFRIGARGTFVHDSLHDEFVTRLQPSDVDSGLVGGVCGQQAVDFLHDDLRFGGLGVGDVHRAVERGAGLQLGQQGTR